MKFLVTGAAGFIGANVSKRLLEAVIRLLGSITSKITTMST